MVTRQRSAKVAMIAALWITSQLLCGSVFSSEQQHKQAGDAGVNVKADRNREHVLYETKLVVDCNATAYLVSETRAGVLALCWYPLTRAVASFVWTGVKLLDALRMGDWIVAGRQVLAFLARMCAAFQ